PTAKVLQEATGSYGPLVAALVPSLRLKARGISAAHDIVADKVREHIFEGVHNMLTGVRGTKPLLIVLEDLQWADDATVLMLRDLAERLGGSRIVVLGACWDTELDSGRPFAVALSRMLRRGRAQRIALGRLSDHDVERMSAGLAETPLPPVALLAVPAATERNPLLIEHSMLYI